MAHIPPPIKILSKVSRPAPGSTEGTQLSFFSKDNVNVSDENKNKANLLEQLPSIPPSLISFFNLSPEHYVDQIDVNLKLYLDILNNGLAAAHEKWGKHPFPPDMVHAALETPALTKKPTVIIVGAGMAGLAAAHELLRTEKFNIKIFEATQRVGGRVYTVRSFTDGQYGEGGAMRFPHPDIHPLTWWYFRHLNLQTTGFCNKTYGYFVDRKLFPGPLTLEQIKEHFPGYSLTADPGTVLQLIVKALIQEIQVDAHSEDPNSLEEAWKKFLKHYDPYSLRNFLQHITEAMTHPSAKEILKENFKDWSYPDIDALGVLETLESLMDSSFVEVFREFAGHWWEEDMFKIKGGNDNLPRALLNEMESHYGGASFKIHYSTKVTSVQYSPVVKVGYETPFGKEKYCEGDFVIVTAPLNTACLMDFNPPLSHDKQRGIRTIHYANSVKLFAEMSERFWECKPPYVPETGGAIKTELPIRSVFFPSNYDEHKDRVLLLSYVWEKDANVFSGGIDQSVLNVALSNLQKIFPNNDPAESLSLKDKVVSVARVVWGDTPWALGGFAYYNPGQYLELWKGLKAPEYDEKNVKRFFLAGEATSHTHGWVQGAIESALRTVYMIYDQYLDLVKDQN